MGKKSNLSVPQRREVVLMLLRREEPAAISIPSYCRSEYRFDRNMRAFLYSKIYPIYRGWRDHGV